MPEFICKTSKKKVEYPSLKYLNPKDFLCLDKIINTDGSVCCKLLGFKNNDYRKCPEYYLLDLLRERREWNQAKSKISEIKRNIEQEFYEESKTIENMYNNLKTAYWTMERIASKKGKEKINKEFREYEQVFFDAEFKIMAALGRRKSKEESITIDSNAPQAARVWEKSL